MPKQVQAQQQTVIVKVAAPEKKRRKRRTRRKTKQPTGDDVLAMAQPIAVYKTLGSDNSFGAEFRELLSAVSALKLKQAEEGSFRPEYVRRPTPTDIVMQSRPPEEGTLPPVETAPAETQTEPPAPSQTAETQTVQTGEMEKTDFDSLIKYMKKADKGVTAKNYKSMWSSFNGEDKMLVRLNIQNSKMSKDKKQKLLGYLDSI